MEGCESSDGMVDAEVCLQSPSHVFDVGSTHLFPVLSEPGLIYSFDNNDSSSSTESKERHPPPSKRRSVTTNNVQQPASSPKSDYHKKYLRMKKKIKETIFLNSAVHDEAQYTELQVTKAKQERKMLLKKIFQYLPMTENQAMQSAAALKSIAGSFDGKLPPSILDPAGTSKSSDGQGIKRKRKISNKQRNSNSGTESSSQGSQHNSSSRGDTSKPKRRKPGTAMNRKVQLLPKDGNGNPIFPITLGSLTVHSLGKIAHAKPGFHSERYLWPVGYCSSRIYSSMLDPEKKVKYVCVILDSGTDPVFQVTADDDVDNPITAATATACHCSILKRLNLARGKEATNTGSGPEFFGFSHPTIQYLLQCLPNAKECRKYNWVKFELPPENTVPNENIINAESSQSEHDHSPTLSRSDVISPPKRDK